MRDTIMKFSKMLVLMMLPTAVAFAQNGKEQFTKLFFEFRNASSLTYNGSFKTFGAQTATGVVAEGRISLEKKDFDLIKYRASAISEVPILNKTYFEDVLYD